MNTHTNTKIKLKKQIFFIDIFYNNYKEKLYNIFNNMLYIVATSYPIILNAPHHIKHNAKIQN